MAIQWLRKSFLKLDAYTARMALFFLVVMTILLITSLEQLAVQTFVQHGVLRIGTLTALAAAITALIILFLGHYQKAVSASLFLLTLTPLLTLIASGSLHFNSIFCILLVIFYALFSTFWLTLVSVAYLLLIHTVSSVFFRSPVSVDLFRIENIAVLSVLLWVIGLAYLQARIRKENMRLDAEKKQLAAMLLMQSRNITLGETIGNVGHQWRQPLNNLGLILQNIKSYYDQGALSDEIINKYFERGMGMVEFLDLTLEDYLSFFRQCPGKEEYALSSAVKKALSMLENMLAKYNITLSSRVLLDSCIQGCMNDVVHVILNLVNNAKDMYLERKIAKPEIIVTIEQEPNFRTISVRDNAGGILVKPVDKIFQPFFTTRPDGHGIGLYLVRKIVEDRLRGTITARNNGDGAEFLIKLPVITAQNAIEG